MSKVCGQEGCVCSIQNTFYTSDPLESSNVTNKITNP
jgi:hypothetical protein